MLSMNAKEAVKRKFSGGRRLRGWRNHHFGGMNAVTGHPVSICGFRPDEGGTVSTKLNVKLAPVSGYMRSNAYVEVVQVLVPYQACEKLELDTQEDAGVTEMTRRRLMAGEGLGLEDYGEIAQAANVHPISIGGVKKNVKTVRLSYVAAMNHLRKAAYFAAGQRTKTQTAIMMATLTANVLQRYNGVMDPERHIDGAINLTGDLPVKGIANQQGASYTSTNVNVVETGAGQETYAHASNIDDASSSFHIETDASGVPQIFVDLDGASELTLRDMIKSQKLDGLIRQFAKIIKDDPVNGEEAVERALYGLSVDYDHNCQVMYRQVHELKAVHTRPMDGASINDVSANFELDTRFATVVPRMELGGELVTIVMVKPLETIVAQPDPLHTQPWQLINRVQDETELDETLLTRRNLESGVPAIDEDQPVFWVGHNSLEHRYETHGANEYLVPGTQLKSSMWTYPIPVSASPENTSYPNAGVDMYPFHNWNGAHAEFTVDQVAAISTPLALGPNPVERIQLFADDPALISAD